MPNNFCASVRVWLVRLARKMVATIVVKRAFAVS